MGRWIVLTLSVFVSAALVAAYLVLFRDHPPGRILDEHDVVVRITYYRRGRWAEVADPGLRERVCEALRDARALRKEGPDLISQFLRLELDDGGGRDVAVYMSDGHAVLFHDHWSYLSVEMRGLLDEIMAAADVSSTKVSPSSPDESETQLHEGDQ